MVRRLRRRGLRSGGHLSKLRGPRALRHPRVGGRRLRRPAGPSRPRRGRSPARVDLPADVRPGVGGLRPHHRSHVAPRLGAAGSGHGRGQARHDHRRRHRSGAAVATPRSWAAFARRRLGERTCAVGLVTSESAVLRVHALGSVAATSADLHVLCASRSSAGGGRRRASLPQSELGWPTRLGRQFSTRRKRLPTRPRGRPGRCERPRCRPGRHRACGR